MSNLESPVINLADFAEPIKQRNLWIDAARQFARNKLAILGALIVLILVLMAIFGPALAPYDFLKQDLSSTLQPPNLQHLFGTDELGRDIFSRILYGSRTAMLVAITTTVISLLVGVIVGTLAGFSSGWVDELLMWLSDFVQSVPDLLLVVMINTAMRQPIVEFFDRMYEQTRNTFYLNTQWLDFVLVFGALALISWPGFARLVRGQVLTTRESEFIVAAKALGATNYRIMLRHVIPNSLGALLVAVSQRMGAAVVMESGLSFLGIGVQPPNASWGSMLSKSLPLWQMAPHLMIVPAVIIGLAQVGFVFFGDGLNDALNPRQRK
jgi:peptide/nickel transport system permease protein